MKASTQSFYSKHAQGRLEWDSSPRNETFEVQRHRVTLRPASQRLLCVSWAVGALNCGVFKQVQNVLV